MARTRRPLFPLAADQLPRIHVSPEQHDELRAYVLPMVHEVVRDGPTWGRSNVRSAQREGWKVATSSPDGCFLTKSSGRSDRSSRTPTSTKSGDSTATAAPPKATASMQPQPRTPGQSFMGASRSLSTLEDVMSSVYCETTDELRVHLARAYGGACLDCCVLATLEGATLDDPFWYIGIKWVALRSPARRLVSSREFVFVEHSGSYVQRDGERLLYRIFQSINIRAYGGQDAYFGFTRGHVEGAIVYWLDDVTRSTNTAPRPQLNVATKGRAHLRGNIPLWLVQKYLTRYWHSKRKVGAIDDHAPTVSQYSNNSNNSNGAGDSNDESSDEVATIEQVQHLHTAATGSQRSFASSSSRRKLSTSSLSSLSRSTYSSISSHSHSSLNSSSTRTPLEMATQWVPDDARATCFVCDKRFQRVRRPKHHCRSCGEVMCNDCTRYSALAVPPALARRFAAESERKRDNSTRAAIAAGVGKPARSTLERSDASDVATVIVGKVCLRCIELQNIMHNNSAFMEVTTESQPVHAVGATTSSYRRNCQSHSNESNGDESFGALNEEKAAAVANRADRQSSLSSSEVRALLDERRSDARSDATRAASARATDTMSSPTYDDSVDNVVDSVGNSVANTDNVDSVANHDNVVAANDDDVGDDNASESLEFQPVLVNDAVAAAALELLPAATSCDSNSSLLTSFDPDVLFNLHEAAAQQQQQQLEFRDSNSECLDSDDDLSSVSSQPSGTSQQQQSQSQTRLSEDATQQRLLLVVPLSPSTASASTCLASPSTSSVAATSTTAKRSARVSITDVKLAIADHAKLLDVIKHNHNEQLVP